MLLPGFSDTWRTWELVLPALERRHDVLALTLAGHTGGPPLDGPPHPALVENVERAMDEAGFATAHFAGNSLGGYLSLRMAAAGRARSVVALAPAGGWAAGDRSFHTTLEQQSRMTDLLGTAARFAEMIVATESGRRQATSLLAERFEHIPPELIAHLIRGAAACSSAAAMIQYATGYDWPLRTETIACPVRVAWGTADRLLPWPRSAARLREELPQAEWIELDGVGHCPQLDVPLETAQLILGLTSP